MTNLLLEQDVEIEAKDGENRTPLHLAAWRNSAEVAQLLIERGAKIEAKKKLDRRPLQSKRWKKSITSSLGCLAE